MKGSEWQRTSQGVEGRGKGKRERRKEGGRVMGWRVRWNRELCVVQWRGGERKGGERRGEKGRGGDRGWKSTQVFCTPVNIRNVCDSVSRPTPPLKEKWKGGEGRRKRWHRTGRRGEAEGSR